MARTPAPEPRAYSNNSNGVPSYVAGNVGRQAPKARGTIKSERSLTHNIASPFFTGPLRSPARLQNTFAHECFMDELAARAKADPVAFRLRHLSDSRLIDVVKGGRGTGELGGTSFAEPAEPAGREWSPAEASLAWLTRANNGFAAMVAEVEVDQETGKVQCEADFFRQRFRADLEPERSSEPDRRRRLCRA